MSEWFDWRRLFGGHPEGDTALWPPPLLDEPLETESGRAISPAAAPVHVTAGTALVRVDNGVLVVEREGEAAFERPLELVSAVHIHGWATITSPCIAQLIGQGTPVVWRGATGYPIGLAQPMHEAGLEARRAQYAASGGAVALRVARALVSAKIVNMRGLVRRRATISGRDGLQLLDHYARKALSATTIDTLLGIEGASTALYFGVWPHMLSARAGDMAFDTRTRRPPQNEVNALLSYTYSVLTGECVSACAAAGLDVRQGFLHRPRAGRPSLALDLMEPFRPLIADQAVLSGLNNGQIKPHLFVIEANATLLNDAGRKLALELLEKRFLGSVTLEGRTEAVTWRACIGLSAQALAECLRNGTTFKPVERG